MEPIPLAVRMPMEPCVFSCPDGSWLHADDCYLSRVRAAWDAVDDAVLRVFGAPYLRRTLDIERVLAAPEILPDWMLVERHARWRLPFVYPMDGEE